MSPNKSVFLIAFFTNFVFICIKMSKDSSAKHYQGNKEGL